MKQKKDFGIIFEHKQLLFKTNFSIFFNFNFVAMEMTDPISQSFWEHRNDFLDGLQSYISAQK